jgi:MFS family permease
MLNSNPQSISGLLMAITVLTASGSMISSGKISDIFRSRIPVLLSFLLVSFVGFVLLATAESALTLIVACGFIGAGQGGTSGPLMALLADLTPDDQMGRATGTNNMMGDIGGGIGPVISLSLIDAIGFKYIYLSCATIPLFAGLILIGGIYTHTGDINPDIAPSSDD